MSRQEYLDLLKYYLKDFPSVVVKDIVADYEEHFNIGLENGKAEDQISQELGSPETIAKQFLENEGRALAKTNTGKEGMSLSKIIIGSILVVLLIPVILPILGVLVGVVGTFVGLIFAIIAMAIAIFALGVALLLSLIPGFLSLNIVAMPAVFAQIHPITIIFTSVALISGSILTAGIGINFFKWLFKSLKNLFITIKWKIEKRGVRDEK